MGIPEKFVLMSRIQMEQSVKDTSWIRKIIYPKETAKKIYESVFKENMQNGCEKTLNDIAGRYNYMVRTTPSEKDAVLAEIKMYYEKRFPYVKDFRIDTFGEVPHNYFAYAEQFFHLLFTTCNMECTDPMLVLTEEELQCKIQYKNINGWSYMRVVYNQKQSSIKIYAHIYSMEFCFFELTYTGEPVEVEYISLYNAWTISMNRLKSFMEATKQKYFMRRKP
jgi:hypothetical protein